MGKWETVGVAHASIDRLATDIRRFVSRLEHMMTGIANHGTLKNDCKLLKEWMHHPRLWFEFLVTLEWFEGTIEPVFERLRGVSKIYPESGPHFGREKVPRYALGSLVPCNPTTYPD